IMFHTREAGVRELQRKIAALFRCAAEKLVEEMSQPNPVGLAPRTLSRVNLTPERLPEYLGPERYCPELAERVIRPGIATGLAWTPHGGELLFIEATSVP